MRLRRIVGQPGSSSIISRVELGQTTIQLRKRAGFDDVGHRLGLTTGTQISVCKEGSEQCVSPVFRAQAVLRLHHELSPHDAAFSPRSRDPNDAVYTGPPSIPQTTFKQYARRITGNIKTPNIKYEEASKYGWNKNTTTTTPNPEYYYYDCYY